MALASKLFNVTWYLEQNPDVARAVDEGLITATQHFELHGKAEGRSPGPLFDPTQYLVNNPDVAAAVNSGTTTAFDHFVTYGVVESRSPINLFDETFYLSQNADVAAAVESGTMTAVHHFLMHGQSEPRPISPAIDLSAYLTANPDVGAAVEEGALTAMEHIMLYAVHEGRDLGNGISLAQFDADPVFQGVVLSGDIAAALDRVEEIAPFIPTYQPPEGYTIPADTPIPMDFVPVEGEYLVVPDEVTVPDGTELPDSFRPSDPPPGGSDGETTFTVALNADGVLSFGGSATGTVDVDVDEAGQLVFTRSGLSETLALGGNNEIKAISNDDVVLEGGSETAFAYAEGHWWTESELAALANETDDPTSLPIPSAALLMSDFNVERRVPVNMDSLAIVAGAGATLTGGFDIAPTVKQFSIQGLTVEFAGNLSDADAGIRVDQADGLEIRIDNVHFVGDSTFSDDRAIVLSELENGAKNVQVDISRSVFWNWGTGISAGESNGNSISVTDSEFVGNLAAIGSVGDGVALAVSNNRFDASNEEELGITGGTRLGELHLNGNVGLDEMNVYFDGSPTNIVNELGDLSNLHFDSVIIGSADNDQGTGADEEGEGTLDGDDGHNLIIGGDGADYLRGLQGADLLIGGAGNDRLFAGQGTQGENPGTEVLIGGDGADFLSASSGDDPGTTIMFGGSRTERDSNGIYGESQNSDAVGLAANSWLRSSLGDDVAANQYQHWNGHDVIVATADTMDIIQFYVSDGLTPSDNDFDFFENGTLEVHNFDIEEDSFHFARVGSVYEAFGPAAESDIVWNTVDGESDYTAGTLIVHINDDNGTVGGSATINIDLLGVKNADANTKVADFFHDDLIP